MPRPRWFCLAFVLLLTASPITVPPTESSAAETAARDPDALPRITQGAARHGAGNQARLATEETEQDRQAAIAQPVTTRPPVAGPDHAGPGETGPVDTELSNTVPEDTESAEIESLTPIETRSSIRVNANVSLPQDI